jgi:hypothetical protein
MKDRFGSGAVLPGVINGTARRRAILPVGPVPTQHLCALGQVEREIIVERTRAGLIAAAACGRRGGRPASLDDAKIRAARAMLAWTTCRRARWRIRSDMRAASTLYRHLPGDRSGVEQVGA